MFPLALSLSGALFASSTLVLATSDATVTYSHVIIGGGTAGLALAARLTENSANSVLVLEAGIDGSNNPNITDMSYYGNAAGTRYDWNYTTVPLKYASGRSIPLTRGKVLGGSSALNGAVYNRGHKFEYNLWETVGGSGWNWDSIFAASKKSEHFWTLNPANPNITYDVSNHGTSGPVQTSNYYHYPEIYTGGVIPSVVANGGKKVIDQEGGDPAGIILTPRTMQHNSTLRSYSANAYYTPNKARSNFKVLTSVEVSRILWSSKTSGGLQVATGVEYLSSTGIKTTINAKKVILSAGVYKSPQILELSGVGNPSIINPLGIKTVINLPGVGENLNDQPLAATASLIKNPEANTVQPLVNFESPLTFLSAVDWIEALALLVASTPESTGLSAPLLRAHQALFLLNVPWVESYIGNYPPSLSFAQINLHPLSRGSVHINSTNPSSSPAIDLALLRSEFDQFIIRRALIRSRRFAATAPLSNYLSTEVRPGPSITSDADLKQYVKDSVLIGHHGIGSCLMGPREDGGVVDPSLKVYGTSNVYVVDASIIPIQPSAHTSATVYAVAERAATWL